MKPVADVQTDRLCPGRAADAAVGSGDRQRPDPRNIAGEARQILIALARIEWSSRINPRHDLQERTHRQDDLVLCFGAAPGKLDNLGMGARGVLAARLLDGVNAL